jgi:TonB family protein
MNRPDAPIRREEARLPEAGSTLLRRYTPLSLAMHLAVAGISLISFPALRSERPIFAQPIYEVALVPGPSNYEPPIPQPTKRKEPLPVKPQKTEAKPKQKAQNPKETIPVKSTKPPAKTQKPPDTTPGTSEKAVTPSPTSAPEEHPVSMGQVDQQNFHHDYYLESIRSILVRLWDPPSGGSGLLQASVHFVVARDGSIEQPEIVATSGWSLYDRSALAAVQAATHKFPPLPEGYEGDQLGLTVNFQRVGEEAP